MRGSRREGDDCAKTVKVDKGTPLNNITNRVEKITKNAVVFAFISIKLTRLVFSLLLRSSDEKDDYDDNYDGENRCDDGGLNIRYRCS